MARSRNIKPGFFVNEELAELSFATRLLFIALWSLADREGRLEDRPKKIKAQVFPYDDGINIDEMMEELHRASFIIRYQANGFRYAQVINFTKHQTPHHKEAASDIPPPEGFAAITRHGYDVSKERREAIFIRDGNKCLCCGVTESLSIDHIVPLSKGGDNTDENLQTLCFRCNSSKGDATKSYRKNIVVPSIKRSNYKQDSMLVQRKANDDASCPTDSLNPSSLNPDCGLLIPDSAPKNGALTASQSVKFLTDLGVDAQVAKDWLSLRGKKRAPSTKTAFDGVVREAKKAGMSMDAAIRKCCERGWAGFEAEWVKPQSRASPSLDLAAAQKAANEEAKRLLFGADDGMTIDA